MKRVLFSIFALVAVVASCSKSEIVKTPDLGHEIVFDTYVGRSPITKAQSVDLAYLQQGEDYGFHVYAFLHEGDTPTTTELGVAKPYMDKDVWWEADQTVTGIPTENATTKVIFATDPSDVPATISSKDFVCPDGWADVRTDAHTHFVVMTLANDSWTAGPVILANAGGQWEYAGVTYWPDATSNKKLAFAAYGLNKYNDSWTAQQGITSQTKTGFTFNVASNVADQQDLVVAPFQSGKSIDATATNTTVALNFKHVLSRIGFKLVANQESNVEVIVKNVTLEGMFAKSGSVSLTEATPAISVAEAPTAEVTYSLLPGQNGFVHKSSKTEAPIHINATYANSTDTGKPTNYVDATELTEDEVIAANLANRYMMVIPNEKASSSTEPTTRNYTITVEYQLQDSEPQTAVVELNSWAFMPGYSYEFVLKVSTSAVGFYVEISDWNNYYPTGGTGTGSDVTGIYPLTPKVD